MKLTSTFKFAAFAAAMAIASAETTLMGAANQPDENTHVPPNATVSPTTSNDTASAYRNDVAPGSLVSNISSSLAYGNPLNADVKEWTEDHKNAITQWVQTFEQQHEEAISDAMAMVEKLKAEAEDLKNSNYGDEKMLQKLRGEMQDQVQEYLSDPKHKQQVAAIKKEIKALLTKHAPELKSWIAQHKQDVLDWLAKLTKDVEAGSIPSAYDDCNLVEEACMAKMGITEPDAQQYMREHGAEVQADMGKYEDARNAFVHAHKAQVLKVLGTLTKMVESGDYSDADSGSLTDDLTKMLTKGSPIPTHDNNKRMGGLKGETGADATTGYTAQTQRKLTTTTTTTATPTPTPTPTTTTSTNVTPGNYKGSGSKCVGMTLFGVCAGITVKVDTDAEVHADGTVDVRVTSTGQMDVNLDCPNEPFTLNAGDNTLTLRNYPRTDSSDPNNKCIIDQLPQLATLESLTYEPSQKTIVLKVGPVGLTVNAKLQNGGAGAVGASRRLRSGMRKLPLAV